MKTYYSFLLATAASLSSWMSSSSSSVLLVAGDEVKARASRSYFRQDHEEQYPKKGSILETVGGTTPLVSPPAFDAGDTDVLADEGSFEDGVFSEELAAIQEEDRRLVLAPLCTSDGLSACQETPGCEWYSVCARVIGYPADEDPVIIEDTESTTVVICAAQAEGQYECLSVPRCDLSSFSRITIGPTATTAGSGDVRNDDLITMFQRFSTEVHGDSNSTIYPAYNYLHELCPPIAEGMFPNGIIPGLDPNNTAIPGFLGIPGIPGFLIRLFLPSFPFFLLDSICLALLAILCFELEVSYEEFIDPQTGVIEKIFYFYLNMYWC